MVFSLFPSPFSLFPLPSTPGPFDALVSHPSPKCAHQYNRENQMAKSRVGQAAFPPHHRTATERRPGPIAQWKNSAECCARSAFSDISERSRHAPHLLFCWNWWRRKENYVRTLLRFGRMSPGYIIRTRRHPARPTS